MIWGSGMQKIINQPFNCFRGIFGKIEWSKVLLKNLWGKSLVHYYAGEQDAALAPDNIAKDETPLCQGRLLLAKKQ